jgi:hypothetical protein
LNKTQVFDWTSDEDRVLLIISLGEVRKERKVGELNGTGQCWEEVLKESPALAGARLRSSATKVYSIGTNNLH